MATRLSLAALGGVALALASGCASPPRSDAEAPGAPAIQLLVDRSACAAEAVLLGEPTTVFLAPLAESVTVTELSAGAPVYPCGESAGYRAVMFPRPGEPADCSLRPADRLCPTGWIELGVGLETAG